MSILITSKFIDRSVAYSLERVYEASRDYGIHSSDCYEAAVIFFIKAYDMHNDVYTEEEIDVVMEGATWEI